MKEISDLGDLGDLKPRDADFLKAYLDPESPTYGNQTRSYLETHATDNYMAAAASATRLLKRDKIQRVMSEILADNRAGIADRVRLLSDIAHGTGRKKTDQYAYDSKTGKERHTSTVISDYTPTERVRAIDVLSRLAGDYEAHKVEGELAIVEYRELCKSVFGSKSAFGPAGRNGKRRGGKVKQGGADDSE